MATGLMKLPENRVRRNYTGGAGIDRLHGKARQEDNNMPEEWVGSMVEASNPGMEPIAHEGLAVVETADGPRFLRDIIDDDREFYLGAGAGAQVKLPVIVYYVPQKPGAVRGLHHSQSFVCNGFHSRIGGFHHGAHPFLRHIIVLLPGLSMEPVNSRTPCVISPYPVFGQFHKSCCHRGLPPVIVYVSIVSAGFFQSGPDIPRRISGIPAPLPGSRPADPPAQE